MQCMDFQFQFLVLKYFETKEARLSVSELYDLIAPSMANSGLMEGNEAKFHEVIEAEVQMLSEQFAAIRETGQSGVYEQGLAGDYSDHLMQVLTNIAKAFGFVIDRHDHLFIEAYEKLDAATSSKTCIFTEKDKSDFIRLYDFYVNDYLEYESPLTFDAQMQYLVARIFQSKKAGSRVTVKEIYKALEPNYKIWQAKDRTRTEADFQKQIDLTLEKLSNIKLQINMVSSVKTIMDGIKKEYKSAQKSKSTEKSDFGTEFAKHFHYDTHKLSFSDVIKWYPNLKVWRTQDCFPDYWIYIVALIEDQLDVEHDEAIDSYGYTPFSWEYIFTNKDIIDAIQYIKLSEENFNSQHLYRIGENLIQNIELYVARIKDFETGMEQISLYQKNGSISRRLPFSFMLSKQNDALRLKDIGAGINALVLAKLLKEIKDHYEEIPVQYTCQKIGWNDNAFVGAEIVGEQPYVLYKDEKSLEMSQDKEKALQKWTNLCSKIIKDNVYAQIVLAASFASALIKPLNQKTIIINLCGKSSIGKSTFEALATSIWSKPEDSNIYLTFEGTEFAIIARLNDNYGICVVIDDTSKGKLRDYTNFIYEIENSQSRDRLGKDHKPEPISYWNTSILLSSEISILDSCDKDKEGVLRRLYEFHLNQGDLTKDAQQSNEINSVIKENYGVAGLAFVHFIFDNGLQNDLEDMYSEQLKITREKAGKSGIEQGMAERSAIILLAAQIANDALNLGFNLDSMANCLDQVVKDSVRNFEENHRKFSRKELNEIFNEVLPDIQEKAIKSDEHYYHVLVNDFAEIEIKHGKKKHELRDLFNRYKLTKTDNKAGATTHTITFKSKPRKAISIVKEAD